MDAIVIEGLKVNTVIGCFNWERQIIQPLMLDLTINSSLEQASNSDELQDTLNYAEICEISAQVIQTAAPKLIEHAAKLVLNALFNTFPVLLRGSCSQKTNSFGTLYGATFERRYLRSIRLSAVPPSSLTT